MDCNKDEAIKAKDLAEKKLLEKDSAGAKTFALKAQKLYPELDGLHELLAILDVYISAEKKINGLVDSYAILGVQSSADDDTLRKHYRKLALSLHPDKNKSVGADGAFKILSEAWSLLSDKEKRYSYDQIRNANGISTYGPIGKFSSSVPSGHNRVRVFNTATPNGMHQTNGSFPGCPPFPVKRDTFWTSCSSCGVHFEYLRQYLNNKLYCTNCLKPFFAVEGPWLGPDKSSEQMASFMQTKHFNPLGHERSSGIHCRKTTYSGLFSKFGNHANVSARASSTSQVSGLSCFSKDKVNLEHEVESLADIREKIRQSKYLSSQTAAAGSGTGPSNCSSSPVLGRQKPKKKRRINENGMDNLDKDRTSYVSLGPGAVGLSGTVKSEAGRIASSIHGVHRPTAITELSQMKARNMLMEKAKKEILLKVAEWSTVPVLDSQDKLQLPSVNQSSTENRNTAINSLKMGANESSDSRYHQTSAQTIITDDVPMAEGADPMSMIVPDPDFHDFDGDRTELSFGENQVWAAYDDDDGMPRFYAMIHRVLSFKPFKMQISWLNTKSNNELGPLNWIGSGFYKTSGDFWIGKYVVSKSLNSFSHKVKWSKGRKGAIQIYPRKGDVWALFRNWSRDWTELTPDEVIQKYDMVEILQDYNESSGVIVAPLVKVPGFRTVFHRHLDKGTYMTIPREEMFRLSHQVPSCLLMGEKVNYEAKGCLELDPAATPLELLQVLTKAEVKQTEESARRTPEVAGNVVTERDHEVVAEVVGEAGGGKKPEPEMIVYYRKRRRTEGARGCFESWKSCGTISSS